MNVAVAGNGPLLMYVCMWVLKGVGERGSICEGRGFLLTGVEVRLLFTSVDNVA